MEVIDFINNWKNGKLKPLADCSSRTVAPRCTSRTVPPLHFPPRSSCLIANHQLLVLQQYIGVHTSQTSLHTMEPLYLLPLLNGHKLSSSSLILLFTIKPNNHMHTHFAVHLSAQLTTTSMSHQEPLYPLPLLNGHKLSSRSMIQLLTMCRASPRPTYYHFNEPSGSLWS